MRLQDFRNIHDGEDVLAIGTGPSLLDIPTDFLSTMPSIGVNYLPYYRDLLDGFIPHYWTALDTSPMELLDSMPAEIIRFVPNRQQKRAEAAGRNLKNCVFYEVAAMPRPDRMGYSTSLAAAVQIAFYMGASNVLLAGFDCTKGNKSDALPEPGKTGTQHFYDPDNGRQYSPGWDKNMGQIAEWAEAMGKGLYNISPFTMSRMVQQRSFREWVDEKKD